MFDQIMPKHIQVKFQLYKGLLLLGVKYSKFKDIDSVWYYLFSSVCMHAKSLQLCPILYDPMDCRPSGSSAMGFSRQEYWSGLPCPPPVDLSDLKIELASLMSPEASIL